MATANAYETVVQQLYVTYFGRPADVFGLSNFEAALAAANAPTDIAGLFGAYHTNPAVKGLIDTLGSSAESTALNGTSALTFVTAVYENLFNRVPAAQELLYWSKRIDYGVSTTNDVALSILSAASTHDRSIIDAKVTIATSFTANLDTGTEITAYSGAAAAASARSLLSMVTSATTLADFQGTITATIASITGTVDYQAQYRDKLAASLTSHHLDSSGQAAQDVINYLAGKVTDQASYNQAMTTLDNDATYVHLASHSPGTYNAGTIGNFVGGSANTGDTTPPTITAGPAVASATTISLTSNESGTAGLYDGSNTLVGTAATLTANVGNTITVAAQGSVTTTSLIVKDAANNATTSATKVILGTTGNDTITGTAGNDLIFGFGGTDTLAGGAGADTLVGGAGTNTFKFVLGENGTPSATANFDTIANYRTGTSTISFGFGNLSLGTQVGGAGAGVATVSGTGVLAFNGADTTLAQHLTAAEAALHTGVGNPTSGATVIWQEGADAYVFVSDAVAGVGAGDSLVKLTGVTVAGGGLTFVGGYLTAIA